MFARTGQTPQEAVQHGITVTEYRLRHIIQKAAFFAHARTWKRLTAAAAAPIHRSTSPPVSGGLSFSHQPIERAPR
jgi:hypothetical protein